MIYAKVIADNKIAGHRITTIEVNIHRFVLAELNTHRKFCLSGDSEVWFRQPNGTLRKESIRSIFDKMNRQPLKDRMKGLALNQINEENLELGLTTLQDAIYSGIKDVYRINVGNRSIKSSRDHLFFTPDGWKTLKELSIGDKVAVVKYGKGEEWQEGVPSYVDYAPLDSIEYIGKEDTYDLTVSGKYPNFIAEGFVVHNSRNSASSRAIPISKQIKRIKSDTAWPIEWGTNKPGMQAGEPLKGFKAHMAKFWWKRSRNAALRSAKHLSKLGVHKQVTNRILEPYMWHTVIITSTEWDNFLAQRDSKLAQPEIYIAAKEIREALENSTPGKDRYHLPYIQQDEQDLPLCEKVKISVARCARVSYLTHSGVRDISKDLDLFEKLRSAEPPHWSPMEHVAFFSPLNEVGVSRLGNFSDAWCQIRHNLDHLKQLEMLDAWYTD